MLLQNELEAQRRQELALKQRHEEASALNQLGLVEFGSQHFQKAHDLFKSALEKWPDNPAIRRNYETAHERLEALGQLRKRQDAQQRTEETRRKQAAFELDNAKAMAGMKGLSNSDVGLKGIASNSGPGNLGLKGTGDLRHLDPDRPVYVDPNVVAGRPRAIPAQVSLETLGNPNYNKAFDCLRASDPTAALTFFEAAAKELPGDLMVRNGWLLARDLVKVRETKAREAAAQKALRIAALKGDAYRALLQEDAATALAALVEARALDPSDPRLKCLAAAAEHLKAAAVPGISPEQRAAAKLVGHGMAAFETQRYLAAQELLEVASKLNPKDALMSRMLPVARKYALSDIRLLFPSDPAKPSESGDAPVVSLLFPDPAVPLKEDWVRLFLFPDKKP